MGKKSQISLEFISIFAIGFAITLIIGSLFFTFSSTQKDKLDIQQVNEIGSDIIFNSEEIYFRGSGNKIQQKAQFPEGIESFKIQQVSTGSNNFSEIEFEVIVDGSIEKIFFSPSQDYITLNCSNTCTYNSSGNFSYFNRSDFSAGPKTLSIRSIGDQVLIDFVR